MSKSVRWPREYAMLAGRRIGEAIRPLVSKFSWVGSYRRRLPTLGDVDVLVIAPDRAACSRAFAAECKDGRLESGSGAGLDIGMVSTDDPYLGGDWISVNVFYTTTDAWGAALMYTTGSREFNVRFRSIAKSRGLRVNQYGVFRGKALIPYAGFSERAVCRAVGVTWIPPEARTGADGWGYAPGIRAGAGPEISGSRVGAVP